MRYEKESFCAGIAVGTQLRGWAGVGDSGSGAAGGVVSVEVAKFTRPVRALSPVFVEISDVAVSTYYEEGS